MWPNPAVWSFQSGGSPVSYEVGLPERTHPQQRIRKLLDNRQGGAVGCIFVYMKPGEKLDMDRQDAGRLAVE